jgi:hypothetical protein
MMMNVEQSVEWELVGQNDVLGENLLQCHFVHHKSHMTWTELELGPSRWEASTVWATARPDSNVNKTHLNFPI